jgi:predicted phage terminase large subunit-like protein
MKDNTSNDPSACVTLELLSDYRIMLRHVFNDRLQSYLLPDKIQELANRFNQDGKLQGVIIEDKASGTTAIQTIRATAQPWLAEMIREFEPRGTKEYRGRQASVWCSRDCILFPWPHEDAPWLFDFADPQAGQLFRFPRTLHDDMVDAFSMGIIYTEHLISQGWQAREGWFASEKNEFEPVYDMEAV